MCPTSTIRVSLLALAEWHLKALEISAIVAGEIEWVEVCCEVYCRLPFWQLSQTWSDSLQNCGAKQLCRTQQAIETYQAPEVLVKNTGKILL